MTVAPTLQKGLKRLYSSSVLQIIAALLAIVGAIAVIIGLVSAVSSSDATGGLVAAGIGGILAIISPILVIIAAILSLVGIINVSRENLRFKIALYAVLANIVLTIINIFVSRSSAVAGAVITLLAAICNVVMFLYVCNGIKEVGRKLGRSELLSGYNAVVIFYLLSAILSFIGGFLALTVIGYVLQLIGSLCSLIAFFLYMGYLNKAIKAVQGVPTAEPQQI